MNIEEILQDEIPIQLGEDDLKEQLNILVSSGRAKMSEEEVKKLSKRY